MTRTSAPGLRGRTEKQRELGVDDEDPAAAAAELVTASPDLPWRRASGAPPGLVVAIERVGSTASSRCRHPRALFTATIPGEPSFGFGADLAGGPAQRPVSLKVSLFQEHHCAFLFVTTEEMLT